MRSFGLAERLNEPGPKRILTLDGGGIRGLISLGFLSRIEAILRDRHEKPQLVLSDYFDLFGGTSTGALIATLLALGWDVASVKTLYHRFGKDAFQPRKHWLGAIGRKLGAKFDEAAIETILRRVLGNRNLGTYDFRAGLVVVTKRIDTGSVWVLTNLPSHRFYEMNRQIRLWELLRASTAAPTYFQPKLISDIGHGEQAVFVDGGVSMHHNPALQILMVATLKGFGLQWPFGEERLLLCSVGSGSFHYTPRRETIDRLNNLSWAPILVSELIDDASELNQTILQWMSQSPTAKRIDSQVGALESDLITDAPLLSYLRYNVSLDCESLNRLGFHFSANQIRKLWDMSNVQNLWLLAEIGVAAADEQVKDHHFAVCFDRALPNRRHP